jgi:hypothetical protein
MKRNAEGIYLIESDRHFPYEDKAYSSILLQVAIALGKDVKGWVNLGDLLDNPQCSRHLKDPRRMAYLDEDIEKVNAHLDDIEAALPAGTTVDLLEGNHEDRIRRYVLSNASAVAGLVSTLPREFSIGERNGRAKCKWLWHGIEDWRSLHIGDTLIHHGVYYDKHCAQTNLDRYCAKTGLNFIQGHTHRLQYAHNGTFFSATLGHGSAQQGYEPTPCDHVKAFGLLTLYKGKTSLECYIVENDTAVVRGKIFRG